MTIEPFDVVILGGGNAGIAVTGPVRRAGMSVAMIEARDLGGACPNRPTASAQQSARYAWQPWIFLSWT